MPSAQRLPVGDLGAAATAVRVDVVGFETARDVAASADQAMMFAAAARAGKDERLVCPAESAHRITRQGLPPLLTNRRREPADGDSGQGN